MTGLYLAAGPAEFGAPLLPRVVAQLAGSMVLLQAQDGDEERIQSGVSHRYRFVAGLTHELPR